MKKIRVDKLDIWDLDKTKNAFVPEIIGCYGNMFSLATAKLSIF